MNWNVCWFWEGVFEHTVGVHLVSFISNVYKQRFFQPVEFSEKNKQRTSWFNNVKQQTWIQTQSLYISIALMEKSCVKYA